MPLPQHIRDELDQKRTREHQIARRDTRRDVILSALAIAGWCALGIMLILTSFAVTNMLLGRVLFWSGLGAGNGGALFTLLAAYRRGEKRGDW